MRRGVVGLVEVDRLDWPAAPGDRQVMAAEHRHRSLIAGHSASTLCRRPVLLLIWYMRYSSPPP
jgi:hypothetical protein